MNGTDLARDDLARDIDRVCRLTGRFELRSGQVASEYFVVTRAPAP